MSKTEEKPVAAVEEVKDAEDSDSSSDEEEIPTLENAAAGSAAQTEADKRQSKSEKKARKALLKLNPKQVEGVNRVTLLKSKTVLLIINRPDVFQTGNDAYVVVGEAQVEDLAAQAQAAAAASDNSSRAAAPAAASSSAAAVEEEGDADETGLEPKDIELVMQQANVSRAKAVAALRKNSDIVTAIMELSV